MKRPWMPLYVADYLNDTAHLTTAEHGAYLLLLMHYWTHGGLPADEDSIRKITKLPVLQWKRSGKIVLKFFSRQSDSWHNKRADLELTKAIEKSKVNSANAQRSHNGRKSFAAHTSHSQSKSSFGKESEQGSLASALDGALAHLAAGVAESEPKEASKGLAEKASKANGAQPIGAHKSGPTPDGRWYAPLNSPEQKAWEEYRNASLRDRDGGWIYPTQWPNGATPSATSATA